MPLPERSARMDGRFAGASSKGWALVHLIRCVESQGVDTAGIRRLPGIGDIADPDLRVPEATTAAAWCLASESTHDDALGIHVAESLPRGAFDLVEYAVRASPSLAVGLERLACYGRLESDRVAARVEINSDGLMLLIRDMFATPLHPARAEFRLAIALKTARECAGDDITPLQVSCAHPAPADVTEHRQFFRVPVRFASGATSLTLSTADASRRMADIPFFLQYSEPAAFHRSFRRWTNQTPMAFRTSAATIQSDPVT